MQKGDLVLAAMQGALASWAFQPADVVVEQFLVFKRVAKLSAFICQCGEALYLCMMELCGIFGLGSVLLACPISLVRFDSIAFRLPTALIMQSQ